MGKLISKNQLKSIALLSMFIDHMYKFGILPDCMAFQILGRLAFPLFAFSVAEGAYYTKSRKKYFLRLLLFALLSEYPFDLMVFGRASMRHQNIIWTFALAVSSVFLADYLKERLGPENKKGYFWHILFLFFSGSMALVYGFDYHIGGVALVMLLYIVKKCSPPAQIGFYSSLCIITMNMTLALLDRNPIQLFGILSIIPLLFYNGEKGKGGRFSRIFYLLYPLHMFLIYLVVHSILQ